MEPVYFVMAILGCADDGAQCSQQRLEPVRYASAAACEQAIPQAIDRNLDVDYPVIGASCMRGDAGRISAFRPADRPRGS